MADIQRGLEILEEGATTGPVSGAFYKTSVGKLFKPEAIQELESIGARLLVGGFTTLPRITAEFESFKAGQISPDISPVVLKRNLENQLKAVQLEQQNLQRIQELQNQGYSEVQAYRQTKKKNKELEEKLLRDIQQSQEKKLTDEEVFELMFGR